jgi:hypothetical protein
MDAEAWFQRGLRSISGQGFVGGAWFSVSAGHRKINFANGDESCNPGSRKRELPSAATWRHTALQCFYLFQSKTEH